MDEKIGPVGEEKPSPRQDNTRDPRETLPRLESTSTCTQSGDSLKAQDLSPTTQLVNAAILESLYELQLAGEISLHSSDSDLNRSQLEPILEEEGSVISEDNLDKERRQSVLDEGIAPPVAEPSETPRTTQIVNSEECVDKNQNHIEKDSVSGSEATREDLGGKNPEDTVQDSGQASGDRKEEDLEVSEKTESGLGRSVETSEQLETATPDPDSEATQPSQDLESEAAEVDKSGGDNSDECCQAVKSDTLGKSERVGDSPGPRAALPRSVEGSFREGTETSDVVNENLRSVERLPEHNSKDTAKEKEDFPDGKDNVTGVETESKETTQADSKKPPPNTMGSGASKDGEFVEDGQDRQYAQRSMAPISGMSPSGSQITQRSGSPLKRKGSSLSRHLSKSQLGISGLPPSVSHFSSSVSKFIDGYEEAIVRITKVGFSLPEITIMEGQSITFVWEERVSMIQVIYDGEKLRPVIGGYQASPDETDGQYELQFNLEGEYKFALNGVRCTPLAVLVRRRMDLQAVVTDEGFSPDIIEIFQGHTVKWSWKQCAVPHTIKEVILCMDRGSFRKQPSNASVVATVSGSYRHTFQRPGLYYFQTESIELGRTHLCVVQVREAPREHKIEILDRSFQPMILLIEEGDRVWFYWDKHKCKKHHSIYQVEAPSIDLDEDEPYIPIKDGFRWTVPSKQGMLSHEFHKTGVYYFSDQNFEEAAEYLGTIIVKPRPKEHHIELKEKGFSPDLLFANTGDRIWWTWDGEGIVNVNETLLVLEEDKCLNPIARRPSAETEAYSAEMYIDLDEASMKLLTRVGHATYHFTTIGVYNFRVADTGDSFTTCSVVVNPGSRNHTVHLTDNGFEPKVITIRPNDRVWWVWQSGKKQHNIIQVSHQGVPITNGFCSGQTRDSPSAFTHQFIMPGVFYFISKNLPKVFGAVVVSTQPQVHEISVTSSEIKPDPVVIQVNDIVAWTFRNPRTFDVALVETVDQVLDAQFSEKVLTPRRCIPRALTTTGIKHYHSKSFQKQKSNQNFMAETKLSSVIADERYDNEVIRVDNQGFHPAQLFLQKGQSVLWTWKGSDIPHNIIHVNSPNSDNPLNVIQGAQSFNSGKPVANNSFLYTFDEEGAYTVASQGAPGFACTISVMDVAPRCPEPRITSDSNGGTVNRYSIVKLACSLDGTSIYYTIDGSLPALHSDATKRYKPEQGVILRDSGLSFVRAMAVIDGYLNSHIFTSNRFWVLTREEEGEGVPEDSLTEDIQDKQETSTSAWNWWNCCPTIKGCFTAPGVMELFWEKPSEGAQHLVKGYQVFLNGVTYCEMFPKDNNSINISGMAGNRLYEVYVEVYPKRSTEEPQKSNKLRMRCPSTTPEGGPVISVEVSEKSDALTIVWMSMDTPEVPIDGYLVFLDDQQCGPKLVPDEDSNRCKVIVGSCELDKTYKIYVLALLKGVDETRMSNILEVELPLDKTQIILPGEDQRLEDDEVYQEYLEIHEGSGYLPEMDKSPTEDVDGRKGEKVDTSPPVMLDASTLEEKNQHASTLPPKVIEVETRGPPLFPHKKRRLRSYANIYVYQRVKQDAVEPKKSGLSRFKKSIAASRNVNTFGRRPSRAVPPDPAPEPEPRPHPRFRRQASRIASLGKLGLKQRHQPQEEEPQPEPRASFSFKSLASSVLEFVAKQRKIQRAVAPNSTGRVYIDWSRLKSFVGSMMPRMTAIAAAAAAAKMSAPKLEEPESQRDYDDEREGRRYRDDHRRQGSYDRSPQRYEPEYEDHRREGHSSRSRYRDDYRQGSFERSPHRMDGYRQNSYDPPSQRGDKYRQASFDRSPRDRQGSFDRSPNRFDSRYDDRRGGYEQTPSRSDYDQDDYRNSYDRSPHRSDYDDDPRRYRRSPVPPDSDYSRRSYDRSPAQSDKHEWYRREHFRRSSDYESDDYMQPPTNSREFDWHVYNAHRQRSRDKGHLRRHNSDPRADSKKLSVPVYRGDEDSDDFGDEEAEHIYQVNRYKMRRKSAAEDKRPKEVQFLFGPGDHGGDSESGDTLTPTPRVFNRDLFSPRPDQQKRPSDGHSRSSHRSNTNLKSILKHSDFFQDPSDNIDIRDEDEGAITPPGEYGGMLHRYLEIFENSPKREDSDSYSDEDDSDDQGVMTDDNLEKSTQTRRGRGKQGQRFDDSPLPQSLIEQSESESESESEFESEEEDFPRNNVVILDATKNQATDSGRTEKKRTSRPRRPADSTQSSPRKRFSPRDGKYIEPEDNLLVTHPDERQPKRKRTMAIVEVQQQVELDVDRVEVQGSSDRPDRKLAVPGARDGASMMQIGEGEFILGDGDGILPAPSIMVESRGKNGVKVAWELPKSVDSQYKLLLYVVNVVGTKFTSDINSDISFECNLVEKGKPVRGVQHCWNISDKQKCTLKGLVPGLTYRVYVIANYSMVHGQQACEIQTTSSVIYYTTMGPPKPPKIKIVSVDLYQAVAEWDPPSVHPDLKLKGYQIYVDNKPLGGVRSSDVRQMVINNLIPGKTLSVYVVAITSRASQESEPSRTMHITCPRRPPAVAISQQPSYKKGCVLVAWDKPRYTHASNDEEISLYSIYIDGHWHGEVKANKMSDKQGYQFFLTDLSPEQPYDISIRAICGTRRVDSDAQHVYCLSDSGMSNIVPVMAPAAPKSPKLRLEGLHPDGIDCTWQVPQQFGDASISGYQMLKNGKLYGSIIPPDVNSLRIRDMMLGEKVQLQLIALTEHPVGKDTRKSLDGDSGIEGGLSQPDERITDVFTGDRYSGCKPGPKLVVHYTGLVQPPREVWCEQVTGHSALIVWNTDFEAKAHFIRPDSYQVTWWPGDRPEEEINSDSTTEDHLLITSLRPCTSYTVVVEARKMEKYTDIDEGTCTTETPDGLNAFILTSKSDQLAVKTASPPDAPRNLGVIATTCNSLKVAWDPPQEHGVEVIAMRIECVSLNANDPHHVSVDTMPDAKMAIVDHLLEKTDYLVRIVAVTDEYFDRLPDKHKYKKHRSIPKETMISPDDSVWLPNASILSKTAGTEPPTNIKVVQSSTTSLRLSWTPPLVYGSNKLQGQIIRWADVKKGRLKDEDLVVASHVNLLATEDSLTIDDLSPGAHYRIVIEAVVSIKTSLDPDKWDSGIEKYRRTAHVMSRALMARTRAPIEPPRLLVSSYTQNTANLYWEKPPLMSVIGKDEDGRPIYLRRYLEGYKLEINGKLQCCLGPAAQSCTLTKCKPGKKYDVTLVALTCTEDAKKERKQKYKGFFKNTNPQDLDYATILDDPENLDEAPSDSVEVTLPKNQEGFISTLTSEFLHQSERDNKTFGDVVLSWTTQGQITPLKQFNVVWYCEDRVIQTKYVQPTQMQCTIPITKIKATYTITVEPVYFTDVIPQTAQEIQIMIPGPPDAPEIFLRTVEPEEFIIEWGEPKLYGGIRIKGYQVYLNDKKAGNELSSSHRKAVIPCRPNRTYKINLVALSSNPEYMDSPKSNGLLVNTSSSSPRPGESSLSLEDWSSTADDHEISLKVTRISENSIHLDWSTFLETEGVTFYKIQWSSVAQPAQREVRLSERDTNCVINKCLPGTTHFVRLVAYSEDGQIMDKSKQLTVQTSAPPDGPVLSIRACNFRYIAIQWDKPNTYGDALVTGYKVYVNGIVEAILNADQLSFTFTHGKWCQEYSFQVQALTATERLNSKPSEPLVVPWPGVKPPAIFRIPSVSSSTLRVGWEAPYMTEGIKVKHYRLCCVEEDTEKLVQSIGPIHPDTREAEFKHLKKGNYSVYLETHLYGTSDVVRSDMIRMQPALSPDPPVISSTIAGLEERRQIEKITCDLVNKRDRLIRAVGHKLKKIGALAHPIRAEKNDDIILGAHTLTRVEELLEDCFNALEQYTGHLIAHVSWQCPQSNPDMVISSYKVLIDGKQYGNAMHSGVKTVRIKLGLEQSNYKLSLVSMSEKPQGTSEESNTVELLATPFKPFSFYCYHAIHNKDTTWPSYGCCKYQDSIMYERQVAKKLANQGLLQKHVPPPACSLLDVFDGVFKPLMGAHKPQHPTVLLFWTPWCLPSQQIMSFYTRFARETAKEFTFVAVTCGMSGVSVADRKSLIHLITSNGWREDGMVWHCTNECASNVYEAANNVRKTPTGMRLESDLEGERQMELTELLGIAGVPTFLFLHPDGYIAWHGRYSAYDYASFSAFMRHTMSEVLHQPCPVYNCDCCKNNMTLDDELFNSGLIFTNEHSRHGSPKNVTIMLGKDDPTLPVPGSKHSPSHELKYVPHNGYADNAAGTDRVFLRRKHSPKRKKTRISVNSRPFSASASVSPPQLQNSPYLARLRPTSPRSYRTRNRPVSANRLNHYV